MYMNKNSCLASAGVGKLFFILEVAPFPGFNKLGPGKWIKDIHGRRLAGIIGFTAGLP